MKYFLDTFFDHTNFENLSFSMLSPLETLVNCDIKVEVVYPLLKSKKKKIYVFVTEK